MSIEFNGATVIIQGTIEKLATFASKGGGVNLTVQSGDDPNLTASIVANRGKIARITFEFSSMRATDKKTGEGDGEFEFNDESGEVPDTPQPGKKKRGKKEDFQEPLA